MVPVWTARTAREVAQDVAARPQAQQAVAEEVQVRWRLKVQVGNL